MCDFVGKSDPPLTSTLRIVGKFKSRNYILNFFNKNVPIPLNLIYFKANKYHGDIYEYSIIQSNNML